MRRWLICVLMTMPLLLAACGGTGMSEAEELALTIRGEYLETTRWTGRAAVTADYGQRVYAFDISASGDEQEIVQVLTQPETVAGMVSRTGPDGTFLEYDGVQVCTGPLADGKTVPMQALPKLLRAMRSGYIRACEEEDGLLHIRCGDPEQEPGRGEEISLWVDGQSFALVRGEIFLDGFCAIRCDVSDFTMMG